MRKLIYIGSEKADEPGAVGTHTRGIVEAFKASDFFDSTIVIVGKAFKESVINYNEGIFIELSKLNDASFLDRLKRSLFYVKNVKRQIERIHNPEDELYVYMRYSPVVSLLLALFLTRLKIKFLVEYNDIVVDQLIFAKQHKNWGFIQGFMRTNKVTLKLLKLIEGFVFIRSYLVVAVTDALKIYIEGLIGFENSKVLVVPNATDISFIEWTKKTDKYEMRTKLDLSNDYFYLSHIGTLTYWDGLDFLIKGLNNSKYKTKIKLLIIGKGSAEAGLTQLIKKLNLQENVIFLPPMDRGEAIQYLIASDIVPLIKTIDTYQLCPIKYYEALGAGKPMITTNIKYINEIEALGFGKVVSFPVKISEITDAINFMYENLEWINDIGNQVIDYAEKNCTWEARTEIIIDALKNYSINFKLSKKTSLEKGVNL